MNVDFLLRRVVSVVASARRPKIGAVLGRKPVVARFRTAHRTANASSSAASNFRSGGDVATRPEGFLLCS